MSVHEFCKSPEGVKAFTDIGMSYPEWQWDDMYEQYLKDTTADPELIKEHGAGHLPIEVLRITRV